MTRYVCIHGHFYQPPRENPWLEEVELEDSAYPYHDWNDKITEECYRPNAVSRILDSEKKIINIANNYTKISFDFGPTLLSWLERHEPQLYHDILEADKKSMKQFGGHGAAIAQAYNHIIMPLANSRDKRTQVIWGIRDFENRFSRKPEGMWLPETAVDMETLEILAENDIKFTILSPHQAMRVRETGKQRWDNVEDGRINTTTPYLCRLNDGKSISIFFYNDKIVQNVISGRILHSGETFAKELTSIFSPNAAVPQISNIASDGETYGHHHRHTDMALAYCIDYIERNNLAKITVYGEYLEKFPPALEVEIRENTSWSCSHGVERWKSNCGCYYGRFPGGKQQYRIPLRDALNWLRDNVSGIYENKMASFAKDPWKLRDAYVAVLNGRKPQDIQNFVEKEVKSGLSQDDMIVVCKLLELQRNSLLMFTSCGWFFDDISGIESLKILQYASRVIQLAKDVGSVDLEPTFESVLEKAPVNVKEFANGKDVYETLIKPSSVDLNRVAAHFALSSIFEEYPKETKIYCFLTHTEMYERIDAGAQTIAIGRASISSNVTLEKHLFDFAVLHFGDHNLVCAVDTRMSNEYFSAMQKNLKSAFKRADTTEIIRIMNSAFAAQNYSIWHLFKDEQRRILDKLLKSTWEEIEASFRNVYEHNYTLMLMMRGMNIPLPRAFAAPAEFVLNQDLCRLIQSENIDANRLRMLVEEAARLSLPLDKATINFAANQKINQLMMKFAQQPENIELLETITQAVEILLDVIQQLNIELAQNIFFEISRAKYPEMLEKATKGDSSVKRWVDQFRKLAHYLRIAIV